MNLIKLLKMNLKHEKRCLVAWKHNECEYNMVYGRYSVVQRFLDWWNGQSIVVCFCRFHYFVWFHLKNPVCRRPYNKHRHNSPSMAFVSIASFATRYVVNRKREKAIWITEIRNKGTRVLHTFTSTLSIFVDARGLSRLTEPSFIVNLRIFVRKRYRNHE